MFLQAFFIFVSQRIRNVYLGLQYSQGKRVYKAIFSVIVFFLFSYTKEMLYSSFFAFTLHKIQCPEKISVYISLNFPIPCISMKQKCCVPSCQHFVNAKQVHDFFFLIPDKGLMTEMFVFLFFCIFLCVSLVSVLRKEEMFFDVFFRASYISINFQIPYISIYISIKLINAVFLSVYILQMQIKSMEFFFLIFFYS